MDTRLKVVVQSGKRENLSKQQRRFLAGLIDRLERADMKVMPQSPTTANVEKRLEKIRQSHGVIILAFAQWDACRVTRDENKHVIFPTEFTHINAAMAVGAARPLLVLREKSVAERGVLRRGYVQRTFSIPNSLDVNWLDSDEFALVFNEWLNQVNRHRHVFLGYSSQATTVADLIHKYLSEELKVSIFDWRDFQPTEMIWESIERAERTTSSGVFLFMSDDSLAVGDIQKFVPRDNVVYEAGYFAGAKGRSHALIIQEAGAKIPTDLNGILRLQIENRTNIGPIETRLRKYFESLLAM
jgi:hypothetical protein